MMLGLLSLALAQAATPAVAPRAESVATHAAEIYRTLDKWKGGVYKKEGVITCRMKTSSGDQAVDLLRCTTMVKCYAPRVEDLDAIAASETTEEARISEMRKVMEEVQPCIEKEHREGVLRIATVRAAQ